MRLDFWKDIEIGTTQINKESTIGKGMLNGIMFVGKRKDLSGDLTIFYRGEKTHYLCNDLNLEILAGIQDYTFGVSGIPAQVQADGSNAGAGDLCVYYIDLGSLHLGNGELVVNTNFKAGASTTIKMYTVTNRNEPMYMKEYVVTRDKEQRIHFVSELFVSGVEADFDLLDQGENCKILIESELHGTTTTDVKACVLAESIFGNVEMLNNTKIGLVYTADDEMQGETIYTRLNGSWTDKVNIVYTRIIMDKKETDNSIRKNLSKKKRRTRALEKMFPMKAKALRHGFNAQKASDLEHVEKALAEKEEKKKETEKK